MIISSTATGEVLWDDHLSRTVRRFDVRTGIRDQLRFEIGGESRLVRSNGDLFVVRHTSGRNSIVFAVYDFERPSKPLAEIDVRDSIPMLIGDLDIWSKIGTAFLYRDDSATRGESDYRLVTVKGTSAISQRLPWHDDYDLIYQGISGVCQMPGTDELLFGVQRSNRLVICDRETLSVVSTMALPGEKAGNPMPTRSEATGDIWVVNYDTVALVDSTGRNLIASSRVQRASAAGVLQFAGELALANDEQQVVIPRPFEGDVLIIDARTLASVRSIPTGNRPLQAITLNNGSIASVDWRTSEFKLTQPARG